MAMIASTKPDAFAGIDELDVDHLGFGVVGNCF
jgi:hypothetical protein